MHIPVMHMPSRYLLCQLPANTVYHNVCVHTLRLYASVPSSHVCSCTCVCLCVCTRCVSMRLYHRRMCAHVHVCVFVCVCAHADVQRSVLGPSHMWCVDVVHHHDNLGRYRGLWLPSGLCIDPPKHLSVVQVRVIACCVSSYKASTDVMYADDVCVSLCVGLSVCAHRRPLPAYLSSLSRDLC